MAHVEFQPGAGQKHPDLLHELPRPVPLVNAESRPFWRAARDGFLLLQVCADCGSSIWYPRAFCPECKSFDTGSVQATGEGTIYSFSIVRRSGGEYRAATPYVLAYVELTEGPRVVTNIVGCHEEELRIGARVRAVFQPANDEVGLVRFELAR